MITKIINSQERPVSGSDPVLDPNASGIEYSGTVSGSTADNVQDAIDEDKAAIKAMSNVYGAKNLLPNLAASGTVDGITYTIYSDGSFLANGTATAESRIVLCTNYKSIPKGTYILSKGHVRGNIYIDAYNGDTFVKQLSLVVYATEGDPFVIDYNGYDRVTIGFYFYNGAQIDNLTFYPMIRDACIQNDTYVLYTMTNRELTEEAILGKYVTLFNGSIATGTQFTLADNLNNYKAFVVYNNTNTTDRTVHFNFTYKSTTSFTSITDSSIGYVSSANAVVFQTMKATSSDGIHYTCTHRTQTNILIDKTIDWATDSDPSNYYIYGIL